MGKHEDRLPIDDQTSPRWIATEAYKRMLLVAPDLRVRITGAQYGSGPSDEGSHEKYRDGQATVYFNESTGLIFVQLSSSDDDDEEEYQVGPQEI